MMVEAFQVSAKMVIASLKSFLSDERLAKIDQVVQHRVFSIQLALENIYDRGNISAVLRSSEALGLGAAHVIEVNQKFKNSDRVSKGAEKWVKIERWGSTLEWAQEMKSQGFQIVSTHLSAKSVPISQVDFSKPSVFVLGNEKDGISAQMQSVSDHQVIIPMIGFVQSFNISVAGALGLYHITRDRQMHAQVQHGDLSLEQQDTLKAYYYLNSLPSGKEYLHEALQRERAR